MRRKFTQHGFVQPRNQIIKTLTRTGQQVWSVAESRQREEDAAQTNSETRTFKNKFFHYKSQQSVLINKKKTKWTFSIFTKCSTKGNQHSHSHCSQFTIMCLDCGGAHGENHTGSGEHEEHADDTPTGLSWCRSTFTVYLYLFPTLKHKMSEHQIPWVLSEQRFVYWSCFYLVWDAERCFEWLILLMKLNHTRQETRKSDLRSAASCSLSETDEPQTHFSFLLFGLTQQPEAEEAGVQLWPLCFCCHTCSNRRS